MLGITKVSDGIYTLIASGNHMEAIDWLQKRFPRKLELYIEKYLESRYINIAKQTDREVISKLTNSEKEDILKRVDLKERK